VEVPSARAKAAEEPAAPYVTPLVQKLATERGVDVAQVTGTGVGGRIRKQDVLQAAVALPEHQPPLAEGPVDVIPVWMPKIGETDPAPDGTVSRWLKQVGDRVEENEPLFEVCTDKVDFEMPSPASGILREIFVAEDDTAAAGVELAIIETFRADRPPA
jgi:pyruvate/2-oxoglutarate dehydrogenase complex dihydrolipoamide acyltransferase (E2) component